MLGGLDYRSIAVAVKRALTALGGVLVGPISTDFKILRADSTQTNGVKWDWPADAVAVGRNIAARTNAATPNTKLDISADQLVVKDANGGAMVLSNVAGTIDFGAVGANGLDTGTQALSTWYYGWVIAKPDGTAAVLGSASSSAPTMPAGYTFKALVTEARSNASTQFIKYRQLGNWVYFEGRQSVLAAGSATTETAITISGFVPPNALAFKAQVDFSEPGAGASDDQTLNLRYVSGTNFCQLRVRGNAAIIYNVAQFDIPNVSQTLFYIIANNTTGTSASGSVDILGFKLPAGGE